jgi:hypothetical protein
MTVTTKVCNRCGVRHPVTSFDRHPMMAGGRINMCRGCRCQQRNAHYAKKAAAMRAAEAV